MSEELTAADSAMVFGLIIFVLGFTFILFSEVFPPLGGAETWCALAMVLGILMIVGGIIMKTREKPLPKIPSTPFSVVTKEKETIVKEVVMVPCQYCGSLMPQTSVFCPHCAAKRKV